MECPNHPQAEVIGYCSVCGAFGCSECLTEHEGALLCSKHYRPVARQIEHEKQYDTIRKKHPRQCLVVGYLDGRREYGVCFAMNLKGTEFHLDLVDQDGASLGKTSTVAYADLKAIFVVKSYDGKFDKNQRFPEWTPEGTELVVKFRDGEMLHCRALRRYSPEDPRFYVVPADLETNNIAVLVERTAIESADTIEEYRAKRAKEREALLEDGTAADFSQEESTGDFYFQTRNYPQALAQYRQAAAKFPQSRRLRKKLFMAYYNVGVDHIKRHEYDKALVYMEMIFEKDPSNLRVKKKVLQLRHIIEKGGKARVKDE